MACVAVVAATASSRQVVMRRVSREKRAFQRDECPLHILCLSSLANHFDQDFDLLPAVDTYHPRKSHDLKERWTVRRDMTATKRRDRAPSSTFFYYFQQPQPQAPCPRAQRNVQ